MISNVNKAIQDTERANSRPFRRSPYVVPSKAVIRKEERLKTIREENHFDDLGVSDDTSTSSGVPDGYEETDIVLCVNGSPVNGAILFNED